MGTDSLKKRDDPFSFKNIPRSNPPDTSCGWDKVNEKLDRLERKWFIWLD